MTMAKPPVAQRSSTIQSFGISPLMNRLQLPPKTSVTESSMPSAAASGRTRSKRCRPRNVAPQKSAMLSVMRTSAERKIKVMCAL